MLVGSIPAMRVRYISNMEVIKLMFGRFNSRYAGKIHLSALDSFFFVFTGGSIPAMRVRYISKNNGKHCH